MRSKEDLCQVDEPFLLQKELRAHLSVIEQKIDRLTLKVGSRHLDAEADGEHRSPRTFHVPEHGIMSKSPSSKRSSFGGTGGLQQPTAGHSAAPSRPSTGQAWPALPGEQAGAPVAQGVQPRAVMVRPASSSAARGTAQPPKPTEPGPLVMSETWAVKSPSTLPKELEVGSRAASKSKTADVRIAESAGVEVLSCEGIGEAQFPNDARSSKISSSASNYSRDGRPSINHARTEGPKYYDQADLSGLRKSGTVAMGMDDRRRRKSLTTPGILQGNVDYQRRPTAMGEIRRASMMRRYSEATLGSQQSDHMQLGRLRSFMKLPIEAPEPPSLRKRMTVKVTNSLGNVSCFKLFGARSLEDAEKTWLWQVVHGNLFNYAASFMIMLNVIAIGLAADMHLKAELKGERAPVANEYMDRGFALFFALELLVRLVAEGRFFLWGPDWKWNFFDSTLVFFSLVDIVVSASAADASAVGGAGRVLRFVRFIRIVRIARAVRAFHSLRIVVYAIFESMLSLVWCFLVVFLIIYMFAIFFLYGVTEEIQYGTPTTNQVNVLKGYYGSVFRAIVTLFMTISGGVDWSDAVQPLIDINWLYEPVFNFYVFFMVIGVLNVVVGAFVAATAEISARDRDFLVKNEINQIQAYSGKVKTFFKEADKDKSGNLSWAEFKEYLKVPKVAAFFQSLDLDVGQAHCVFKLLDGDGSNEVNLDEFLQGCMRLKGPAKSLDMNMMLYENKRIQDKLDAFLELIHEKLGDDFLLAEDEDGLGSTDETEVLSAQSQSHLGSHPTSRPASVPGRKRRGSLGSLLGRNRLGGVEV